MNNKKTQGNLITIPEGQIIRPLSLDGVVLEFKQSPQYSGILNIYKFPKDRPLSDNDEPDETHYWIGDKYDGNCVKMSEPKQ